MTAAAEIGAAEMGEFLCALVRSNLSRETEGIVDLGSRLCARLDDGRDGSWRDTLREVVTTVCTEMPSVRRRLGDDDLAGPYVWPKRRAPVALPAATLRQLFALLWHFGLERGADVAAALFIGREDLVSPDRTIPVMLEELLEEQGAKAGTSTAFAALWHHGAGFLLSRSSFPPPPPSDWIIPANGLSCGCEYCAELRRFCADPDAEVRRIPVRKDLRAHLRRQIEHGGIDIHCETERRGSPYKLVCVKTRATYERRLRQYEEDVAGMRRLVGTAKAVPGSADIMERLRTAIGRSR